MRSACVVYPSEDIHQLRISFPLPSVDEHWRIKPADYVRFIFTHEAPGSLNSYLKTKYVIRASTMESCISVPEGYGQPALIAIVAMLNYTRIRVRLF
jgi:secreted Zn-dependent insulinase-like peptidase